MKRTFRPRVETLEQRLVPTAEFSLVQFEQNIRANFVDNSAGFAYAINQDGATVRHDGWGDARKAADGQVDFTAQTQMTIASVSKTITATSTLKILQEAGISVDSSISPYLPASWERGPNIDSITFKDWYLASPTNQSVINLQAIAEAMADFNAGSGDALRNKKVVTFDFSAIVTDFDNAGATDNWALTDTILNAHLLSGSDTAALGGDLAYQYGKPSGTLAGIGLTPAQSLLSDPNFGSTAQTLQSLVNLQIGTIRLS